MKFLCAVLFLVGVVVGVQEGKTVANGREMFQELLKAFFPPTWVEEKVEEYKGVDGALQLGLFGFLPTQIPVEIRVGESVSWKGLCFGKITASLEADETGGIIHLEASERKNHICTEFYDFGDRSPRVLLSSVLYAGKHKVNISTWFKNEWEDVQQHGMRVFLFPGNEPEVAASVLETYLWFETKDAAQNLQFMQEKLEWYVVNRTNDADVYLNHSDIQSGDVFVLFHSDPLTSLMSWGTGGRASHTYVALWFGDELYIVESDADGFKKTPFDKRRESPERADIVILRLREEYAKHFDEQKAVDWFKTVEGTPYGYWNFIYGFIDTQFNNLPRPITPQFIEQVLGVYGTVFASDSNIGLYNTLIQGLNHRLSSDCKDLECIYQTIDPLNLTLFEVIAMPEQDEWRYTGNGCPYGTCMSRVCDSFVTTTLKEAGVPLPVMASEQTPKDLYSFDMYEPYHYFNKECLEVNQDLPYCQYQGPLHLPLVGFNSVPVYHNANSACPSVPPLFMRSPFHC